MKLTNIVITVPSDINFRFVFDDVLFIRILEIEMFITMSYINKS